MAVPKRDRWLLWLFRDVLVLTVGIIVVMSVLFLLLTLTIAVNLG